MKRRISTVVAGVVLAGAASIAQADDLEGVIESVDREGRTVVVQGILFHTDDRTGYDDGLERFGDLRAGQKVEVDFVHRDGRHHATGV